MTSGNDFSRYSFLPVHYDNLLAFYRKQFDMLWTAQEVDLSQDRADWQLLDPQTQKVLTYVFCFFSQADGLVIENITSRFQEETAALAKEAGHFYIVQNLIETVHNEMYSLMIEVLIPDAEEKAKALNAVAHYPAIGALAKWMRQWTVSEKPLLERIVAFGCIEGVVFVAFFVIIWFVKRQNKLPGVCKANEFIARDEALHTLFAVELYRTLAGTLPAPQIADIHRIIRETVDLAAALVRDALPHDLPGLEQTALVQYVKLAADNLSELFTGKRIYGVTNPFEWMIAIGLPNRTNFFEGRVSEYSRLSADSSAGVHFDSHAPF